MGAGASGGRDPWGVRDDPEEYEGMDNQSIAQQQKTIIQGTQWPGYEGFKCYNSPGTDLFDMLSFDMFVSKGKKHCNIKLHCYGPARAGPLYEIRI